MKLLLMLFPIMTLISCSAGQTSSVSDAKSTADTSAVEFDADSAYAYVARQVDFGPRVPGSEAHGRCVEWMRGMLADAGADTVVEQRGAMTAFDGSRVPVRNLFARFNSGAGRRVLLAAHYDSRPWADEDPDEANRTKPVPGANDGASGVGVLLELARLMGQQPPEVGVDILLVDAEDGGKSSGLENNEESWCLGTQYFTAHSPYGAGERPVYGIVLDMVGGRDARFYREYISEQMAPAVNNKVWGTAARSTFASRFPNQVSGSLIDDHLFLNRAGIPSIDIVECNNRVTGSFPPAWHTVRDDMSGIDRATLKAVGQTVADVVYSEPAL